MLRQAWKNLRTTIFGGTAGGALIQQGIEQKNVSLIVAGAALFLASLFSADAEPKR